MLNHKLSCAWNYNTQHTYLLMYIRIYIYMIIYTCICIYTYMYVLLCCIVLQMSYGLTVYYICNYLYACCMVNYTKQNLKHQHLQIYYAQLFMIQYCAQLIMHADIVTHAIPHHQSIRYDNLILSNILSYTFQYKYNNHSTNVVQMILKIVNSCFKKEAFLTCSFPVGYSVK